MKSWMTAKDCTSQLNPPFKQIREVELPGSAALFSHISPVAPLAKGKH
jgi:hypothetical protein